MVRLVGGSGLVVNTFLEEVATGHMREDKIEECLSGMLALLP